MTEKIHYCSQFNVVKTNVRKTTLAPKTKFSIRSVKMSDNVKEAFRRQRRRTMGKTEYVFLNKPGEVSNPSISLICKVDHPFHMAYC
jgi:hypothetical protein